MQHIVSIAFDFDDKSVSEKIERDVEMTVIAQIASDVREKIFNRAGNTFYGLSKWTEDVMRDVISGWKDEVIEMAAQMLAESYRRTKAWKEKAGQAIEDCEENNASHQT